MMKIRNAEASDIYNVALAMRDADFREFTALHFTDDRKELAETLRDRYGESGGAICATKDDKPIAVGCAVELRPNVVTLLFYATGDFKQVAVGLTRFITRQLFPRLVASGVHRIECVSAVEHKDAHKWIETLGLAEETGALKKYGKNGEDYIQFAWTADDKD